MPFKIVVLWSDALLFLMLAGIALTFWFGRGQDHLRAAWRRVMASPTGMGALAVLLLFVLVAVLDSLHYRPALQPQDGQPVAYASETLSALDHLLSPLRERTEKTFSAPLATHAFVKETQDDGSPGAGARDYPRLKYGGAHLGDELAAHEDAHEGDVLAKLGLGLLSGGFAWALLLVPLGRLVRRQPEVAWHALVVVLLVAALLAGPIVTLAQGYHVFGTDKVGQDVLYLSFKAIRTSLLIGTLSTLIMLPVAILLGILAGYVGGRVDDAVQYLYTTLNSIPGVLLIAASVLMMQVVIDTHPDWFVTSAERADARFVALCAILGITGWTGLARLLRGEAMKLREADFVQAARALGSGRWAIMLRHVLPNTMHIVIIAIVMDFTGLVLAEAVLSAIGIGVDPYTVSFGSIINTARWELAREPVVWWSLVAAFGFMFVLVLAANLFADVVRDAFDPRVTKS